MKSSIPILISLSRLAIAPFVIYLAREGKWPIVVLLIVYAFTSDYFDGFIARKLGVQQNKINTKIDSICDGLFTLALVYSLYECHSLPLTLVIIMISLWWPLAVWRIAFPVRNAYARIVFAFLSTIRSLMLVSIYCLCIEKAFGLGIMIGTLIVALIVFFFFLISAMQETIEWFLGMPRKI
jgi:phosphatidylglycerophosphate synthase